MNVDRERLADYVDRLDVQDEILGAYEGAYSLGLTWNPDNEEEVAIRVRIEGKDTSAISDDLTWMGHVIPILKSPNFKPPRPQGAYVDSHAPFVSNHMR